MVTGASDTKQEVLRATDIVTLVGDYVPLVRGGRNFKALCPFHQEKTPSFTVSPERQTWKCWGCQKGGNAIDFIMEKEGLEFKAALRLLADRAGIRLPEREGRGSGGSAAAARLEALELMRHAHDFFRRSLVESREGERAREYVRSRGIDEESSERFGVGYAPVGGGFLLRYLERRGFGADAAERAGLAIARKDGRGFFDRFRGRLMFPIHDGMARCLGFGGRALEKDDHPKYLNSPETPIFKKRELIYALHLAKDAARERGEVAVVEGYTDAILAHQAGFPWVVSTLGTAFGAEHARALSKLAGRLLIFFDGDAAGGAANRRGLVETGRAGVALFKELRVALLPEGLDPADLIVARGAAALAESIAKAVSLSEFFESVAGRGTAERGKALDEVCEILASLDEETYRELEIGATAHRFRVNEEVVRRRVKHFRTLAVRKKSTDGARGSSKQAEAVVATERPPLDRLERRALLCLVGAPELVDDAVVRGISPDLFRDPRAREVARAIFGRAPLAELEDAGSRQLAAELGAEIGTETYCADPRALLSREWRGVAALLLESRSEPECTKGEGDELQQASVRKRRLLELRAREMGLNSG